MLLPHRWPGHERGRAPGARGARDCGHGAAAGDRGPVSEVTPAAYRVGGLSRFVKLGDMVEVDVGGVAQRGEVVRIGPDAVTVKSFGGRVEAGLGAAVRKARPFSYRARSELEGAGHERARRAGRWWRAAGPGSPHGADRRGTARRPGARPRQETAQDRRAGDRHLLPALCRAAHRHLRWIGGRQIDPPGHAGRVPRLRHGGGGAGRRARPRGARIPRGCARLQPAQSHHGGGHWR